MRVISKNLNKKCPCCNWETPNLYAFEIQDIKKEGICANCFMEKIVDNGMKITG